MFRRLQSARVAREVRRALLVDADLGELDPPPYFVRHRVRDCTFETGALDSRSFPGLLAFHVTSTPERDAWEVSSGWLSRDHYEASKAAWSRRIQAAWEARAGFFLKTRAASRRSWKRIVWTLSIHLAAILGAAQFLYGFTERVLAVPSIELRPGEGLPIHRAAAGPLHFSLVASNRDPHHSATVLVERAWLESTEQPKQTHELVGDRLGSELILGGAGSSGLELASTAVAPGEYSLVALGRARSGSLRGWTEIRERFAVRSWSRYTVSPLAVASDMDDKGLLSATLAVGDAGSRSFRATAVLTRAPGVTFTGVLFKDVVSWEIPEPITTPGSEVAVIRWEVPDLEPFSENTVSLALAGAEGTDWTAVAERVELTFDPAGRL